MDGTRSGLGEWDSSDWDKAWRWRTPTLRNHLLGLRHCECAMFVELQCHYDFIVYLGYIFWRKLLLIVYRQQLGDGPNRFPPGLAALQNRVRSGGVWTPREWIFPQLGVKLYGEYSFSELIMMGNLKYSYKYYITSSSGGDLNRGGIGGGSLIDQDNPGQQKRSALKSLILQQHCDAFVALLDDEHSGDSGGGSSMARSKRAEIFRVDVPEQGKTTLLHYAAFVGDSVLTKVLLHAHLDARTTSNQSAVSLAAGHQDPQCIRLLLDAGASIENSDFPPLTAAVLNDSVAVARLLLDHGVEGSEKTEVIFAAIHRQHRPMVKLLLESGEVPINQDGGGTVWHMTPLHMAAQYQGPSSVPIVKLLLDHGAAINEAMRGGFSPLQIAARCGNEPVIRLLLERGADVLYNNGQHGTALHISAGRGDEAICQLLLQADGGAKAMRMKNSQGQTPDQMGMAMNHLTRLEGGHVDGKKEPVQHKKRDSKCGCM